MARTPGSRHPASREAARSNQAIPDEDVLRFAGSQNRVLLTLSRKRFMHFHATNPGHAGIIVCSFDADFRASAHRVHAASNPPSNLSTSSSQE